jgi:hypothetical protein
MFNHYETMVNVDVDPYENMGYEDLLALGEEIGYVGTGLT